MRSRTADSLGAAGGDICDATEIGIQKEWSTAESLRQD
jgi:hypothetical protein